MRYRLERWLRVGGRARTAGAVRVLCMTLVAGSYLARAHPIDVDGAVERPNGSDRTPIDDNTGLVVRAAPRPGRVRLARRGRRRADQLRHPRPARGHPRGALHGHRNRLQRARQGRVAARRHPGRTRRRSSSRSTPTSCPGRVRTTSSSGDTFVASAASWERLVKTRFGSGSTALAVYSAGSGTRRSPARPTTPPTARSSSRCRGARSGSPARRPRRSASRWPHSARPWTTSRATSATRPSPTRSTSSPTTATPERRRTRRPSSPTDQIVDYFADVHFTSAGEVEAPVVVARFAPNYANAGGRVDRGRERDHGDAQPLLVQARRRGEPTADDEGMHSFPLGTTLARGQPRDRRAQRRRVHRRSSASRPTSSSRTPRRPEHGPVRRSGRPARPTSPTRVRSCSSSTGRTRSWTSSPTACRRWRSPASWRRHPRRRPAKCSAARPRCATRTTTRPTST